MSRKIQVFFWLSLVAIANAAPKVNISKEYTDVWQCGKFAGKNYTSFFIRTEKAYSFLPAINRCFLDIKKKRITAMAVKGVLVDVNMTYVNGSKGGRMREFFKGPMLALGIDGDIVMRDGRPKARIHIQVVDRKTGKMYIGLLHSAKIKGFIEVHFIDEALMTRNMKKELKNNRHILNMIRR
jgi:predicted DNA-binding protein with PD1-like motif